MIKTPITYKEQLELIKKKGFVVEDKESCLNFLRKVSFYRLSAYFLPFKENEKYISGINIKRIERIYDFGGRIRAILFQAIERN